MEVSSVVIFFRLWPWQGELCLQIPAVFWHNVQMYHWRTRRRCAVFVGNMWMITAKSRMIAFTIGLSAIFVQNFTRSALALCALLWDCPFGKGRQAMGGYHNWRTLPDQSITLLMCQLDLAYVIGDTYLLDYHLDFDKLCTTFKKSAQSSTKMFTSALSFERIFLLFVFIRGICNKFASHNESLPNKAFELLLFLSNLWHILHRVNNSCIHDIFRVAWK